MIYNFYCDCELGPESLIKSALIFTDIPIFHYMQMRKFYYYCIENKDLQKYYTETN